MQIKAFVIETMCVNHAPKVNGVQATRIIKQSLPHVRIIGLTMNNHSPIIESLLNAGAEQCLSKDEAFDKLIEMITHPKH